MEAWHLLIGAIALVLSYAAMLAGAIKWLETRLDRQFSAQERARKEASRHWDEKFDLQDKFIGEQSKRLDQQWSEMEGVKRDLSSALLKMAEHYVTRELYLEQIGGIYVKLEKIGDRLIEHVKGNA